MRRLDCTSSNPLKTSNRPDPRFVPFPPLPRAETPRLSILPLISNVHKRLVVDDPPAARCAFSSRLTVARRRYHCHLRAPSRRRRCCCILLKGPAFLTLVPGRSFYTSILLHQSGNPPGCDRPSQQEYPRLYLPTWY
jgi:hypothetical protein